MLSRVRRQRIGALLSSGYFFLHSTSIDNLLIPCSLSICGVSSCIVSRRADSVLGKRRRESLSHQIVGRVRPRTLYQYVVGEEFRPHAGQPCQHAICELKDHRTAAREVAERRTKADETIDPKAGVLEQPL